MSSGTSDRKRLEALLSSGHPCIWISTFDETEARNLVQAAAMGRGLSLLVWSVLGGLRDGHVEGSPEVGDTSNPAAALFEIARRVSPAVYCMLDLVGHLGDERALRALREAIKAVVKTGGCVVLIDHRPELPAVIRSRATAFSPSLPDAEELESLVKKVARDMQRERPIETKVQREVLDQVVKNLRGLTRRQARRLITDALADDNRLTAEDVNRVFAAKRQLVGEDGLLEYIESPASLGDIGGLDALKGWLRERQNALTDEARGFGLSPPRGVLMLGVQGAGKSLCARAIAAAWSRPLMRLDPGVLYDRFIGESERRLRDALRQAEAMAPMILWIDEIEKGFASSASHSVDGGLGQRMFSSLLTWMQEHRAAVFLVATANDVSALPPELLRKGRFDEIFFVDLPGEPARRAIFSIHLKRRGRDPATFDLGTLAREAEGFSGAEIEQAVESGLASAFAEKAELTDGHVRAALRHSPPLSVTMSERIEELRAWARGRCRPAD